MAAFQQAKKDDPAPQEHKASWLEEGLSWAPALIPGMLPAVLASKAIEHSGAFGHWFEDSAKPSDATPAPTTPAPAALDPAAAAKHIDSTYIPASEVESKVSLDPNRQLGALDTKEARLAAMSQINQFNPDVKNSEDYCGPSAIIAGAIYAKGGAGVDALIQQMETDGKGDKSFADTKSMLDAIDKKAKTGKLDAGDIATLQEKLYDSMRKKMVADPAIDQRFKDQSGINFKTMNDYVTKNPAMASMFKDSGMGISFVDSGGGQGQMDHFVLDIQDPGRPHVVYDPNPRKDGKQVVTAADDVKAYEQTKHLDARPQ